MWQFFFFFFLLAYLEYTRIKFEPKLIRPYLEYARIKYGQILTELVRAQHPGCDKVPIECLWIYTL